MNSVECKDYFQEKGQKRETQAVSFINPTTIITLLEP